MMKNNSLSTIFLVCLLGMNTSTNAQTQTASSAATGSTTPQICSDLSKLCQSAGFLENGTQGKNLWPNCIIPLLNNTTVPGVSANAKQIEACKNEINNQPCVKIIAQCKTAGFDGSPGKLPLFDCLLPLIGGISISGVNPSQEDYTGCKTLMDKQIAQQPCMRVMMACKNAGYSPDATNGQLFIRNCYNPVIEGNPVTGVNIDAATAAACKNQTTPTMPTTK